MSSSTLSTTKPISLRNYQIWVQFLQQTWKNIRRSKINYCLGFSACFLVVFVVGLLVTILSKSPLIFLRLAELNKGNNFHQVDRILFSLTFFISWHLKEKSIWVLLLEVGHGMDVWITHLSSSYFQMTPKISTILHVIEFLESLFLTKNIAETKI